MLYYITSVIIPAVNAQSVQILANAEAFSYQLGDNFKLITPEVDVHPSEERKEIWWERTKCIFKKGRLRYLEFALRIFNKKIDGDDIVYTRDILLCYLFMFKGVRVVYEAHQKPSKKSKFLLRRLVNYNEFKVVCISKALQSFYLGEFLLNERRVLVAHDGVDLKDYEEVKPDRSIFLSKLNIPLEQIILLHTGSLYPGRGAELFDIIFENFPDVNLVHIGGSEDDLEGWNEKYKENPFYSFSHMSRNDMIEYQVSCDVLLYPMLRTTKTYWCCSPMKIFEYLASDRPIVCSAIGSLKEVVSTENGFLFDPEDKNSLINSLRKAIDAVRSGTKISNRKHIEEDYTWKRRVEVIMDHIER